MKTLYFDCFAGASGNMILGGLIALGININELGEKLKGLAVADFELSISTVDRSGISAIHVEVVAPTEKKHRHLHNIVKIIDDSNLSPFVKEISKSIFTRLAQAEANVHGIDVERVHFHEVGGLDAIVDIVGACIGFEMLGVERFECSKIHVGSGFVQIEHGTYPVPPPAVAKLLEGVPFYSGELAGELLTPTGAAIITTLCDTYGPISDMVVESTGYGAGSRTYEKFPNVLRMFIGTHASGLPAADVKNRPDSGIITETLCLVETNIDDQSGQITGFALERALALGALDSWVTPIQMKKNRPAVLLSVLCDEATLGEVEAMLFTETTSIGVRVSYLERRSLPRGVYSVETRFGRINVKTASFRGTVVNMMPEYEDVRQAALNHGTSFRQVHSEAIAAYQNSTEHQDAVTKV